MTTLVALPTTLPSPLPTDDETAATPTLPIFSATTSDAQLYTATVSDQQV